MFGADYVDMLSRCFQKSHVGYSELRELVQGVKEGFTRVYLTTDLFLGGPCYNDMVAEAGSRDSHVEPEGTQCEVQGLPPYANKRLEQSCITV